MKRRTKTPKPESGDEVAAATAMPASRLTVTEAKELIMGAMKKTQALDYLRLYLEKNLRLAGWRDLVKNECHNYIRERGPDNVNISHMISDLLPSAKESVDQFTKDDLKNILRAFALEIMTVDDSVPPPIETEVPSSKLPYELQPRDSIPEPATELLFTRQGPLPRHRIRTPPQSPASSQLPVESRTSLATDLIEPDREKEYNEKAEREAKEKEKADKEGKEKAHKEKAEREREKVDKEREKEKAEKGREKEKAEKEREKEKAEKIERDKGKVREKERLEKEREQKERDRHERQERHNLNLVSLSASLPGSPRLPASPRSPSVRPDKKLTNPEPSTSKLGSHAKHRAAPEPIKATGLASTLLTATAAIAGKKSKHINLNSDDDDDDDDDEELMDI